ncbi:DNA-processing protein DprA [Ornithinibacillus xuwenensis]|uniref:DNA-processing protein DprA n=1 Tax=Ornithinibacillus xuwenensis TaxID=3144668 RepID=A0ABU9XDV4_9BACI
MYTETQVNLLHLHRCRGISRSKLRKLLQIDPSLQTIYSYSSAQIIQYLSIPHKKAEMLYHDIHNPTIRKELFKDLQTYRGITINDELYPPMLKTIKDAPLVLYASGDVSLLKKLPAISVIGTRSPSPMASHKIKFLVTPLVKANWVVISGMAKGIDSYAHQLALHYQGKTIAVLGSGFRHIYPRENQPLFHQIEHDGLVLSEYPPNTPPKPYYFPERNRIISGLSFGTLVIEATEKSGTLITVNQALDQGREVYAVPGSPHILQSKGCLKLIQEGAKLVITYEDIHQDWELLGDNWMNL